jgi:hypothetical protein
MDEELKERILKDLMKSGFPFEARIARSFANLSIDENWEDFYVSEIGKRPWDDGGLNKGMPVKCGSSYLDPIESKARELDIHSIVPLDVNGANLLINFLVQCKATDKIWVFCHYGFEPVPTLGNKCIYSGIEVKSEAIELGLKVLYPDPVLKVDPRMLCGTAKALSKKGQAEKGRDEIWDACLSAVSATTHYIETAERLFKSTISSSDKKMLLYIPMVATSNMIFFADLSQDEPILKEVDFAYYVYDSMIGGSLGRTIFIIPIITESSLERIVNAVTIASIKLLETCFTW